LLKLKKERLGVSVQEECNTPALSGFLQGVKRRGAAYAEALRIKGI